MAECSQHIKHAQGKPLTPGEKRIINLVKSILRWLLKMLLNSLQNLHVSVNSINAVRLEISMAGKVTSPANKKKRKKPILDLHCDEFVKSAVRRKLHQFYVNNEPPTVSEVLLAQ